MSVPLPGRFPVTVEPGRVSPELIGHYRVDHRRCGIVRVTPATDRM
jgi:hypothetical protein